MAVTFFNSLTQRAVPAQKRRSARLPMPSLTPRHISIDFLLALSNFWKPDCDLGLVSAN